MKNAVIILLVGILLLIVAFYLGYNYKPDNLDAINNLSDKLNESQKTNVNLNAYVVSLESQLEDYKQSTKLITSGTVPFLDETNGNILNLRIPMDYSSVRKATMEVIKVYAEDSSDKGYKVDSLKKENKVWTVNIVCDTNITQNSLCNGTVTIDEVNRVFSLSPQS
jgi:hypothetical protein